jgi:sterol 3beta-glucosyltransferase
MDQFFWGWRLNKLGAAPKPIPHKKMSAEKLAHAVTEALSNQKLRGRVAELAAAVRNEDGLTVAAEFIEGTNFERRHSISG